MAAYVEVYRPTTTTTYGPPSFMKVCHNNNNKYDTSRWKNMSYFLQKREKKTRLIVITTRFGLKKTTRFDT